MQHEAKTRFASYMSAPVYRERYMDSTARLRLLKPAIDKQTDAESALMAKKYSEGESLLKQALKLAPKDYTGLVLMAKTNILQEKYRESIPYLDRAITVYPEEAQARQLRGVVDAKLGKKQAALDHFYACAAVAPHNRNTAQCIAILEATC
jgi:tetratricopeptide (TPR) repeat protein